MDRPIGHTLRAGATVVAATAALSVTAYTGQTTDGFIHTNFSGPLSVFGAASTALPADVLAIGDGRSDASELAAILKTTARPGAGPAALQLSVQTNSAPGSTEVTLLPGVDNAAAAPAAKTSLHVSSSPVLDANGKPDCSAAVSCVTDPTTKATTVTLANGVVAVVQTVNDMTLVAYKSVGDVLEGAVNALSLPGAGISSTVQALAPQIPSLPLPTQAPTASPAPAAAVAVVPAPQTAAPAPAPETAAPAPATSAVIGGQLPTAPSRAGAALPDLAGPNGPTVTVSRAPQDFGLPRVGNPTGTVIAPSNSSAIDTVKGAVDTTFNAVKDAVGKIGKSVTGNSAPSSDSNTPGR